jgi:hypothetical protein
VDEETAEETLHRLKISRERWQAWNNAADAHVWPKAGSMLHLASVAKAWREYEALKAARLFEKHGLPNLPRTEDSLGLPAAQKLDELEELELRYKAQMFEAYYTRAFHMKDHKFCRRLAEAFALPDEEISRLLTTTGAVVWVWRELGGLSGKRPGMPAIRSRVESLQKGEKTVTDRQWERIWKDKFVAALLRCR